MSQRKNLNHVLGIAMLAMMFGASSVYAQSSAGSSSMRSGSTSGGADTSSQGGASSSMSGNTATSGTGSKSSGQQVSRADQDLMRDMAHANLSEIEAGKLAQSKSQNDEVKNFAQRMIDDHTKSQQELQQLAEAKGVTLPTEPDMKHKTAVTAMKALSGDKFDKAYMKQGGVNDHRTTHQLLARVESRAKDPQLKELAAKMLSTVDQHLSMAQGVKSSTQASGSSGSKGRSASGSDSSKSSGSSDNK